MKIYIGGVHGVGKSVICSQIAMIFKKNFKALDGSYVDRILFEEARNIELFNKDQIYLDYYNKFENLILNGHFFIDDIEKQNFDIFIFMTAKPEVILNRRIQDIVRTRNLTIESVIQEEKETLDRIKSSDLKLVFVIDNSLNIQNTIKQLEQIIYVYEKIKQENLDDIEKFIHKYGLKTVKNTGLIKTNTGITKW